MLISKTATVFWNPRNKKHFVDCGYQFTKMRDPVEVDVAHLTNGSNAHVTLQCDYCGKKYKIEWQTYIYIHKKTLIDKDACADCCERKCLDSITEKYGSYSGLHSDTDAKRRMTNVERYGCENVFGSAIIQEKIADTTLERYGVKYCQQAKDVHDKTVKTCLEKYGVENYVELFKGRIKENSPAWKGGVAHSRVERATYEYRTWRISVFERDNYTCVACGCRNGIGNGYIELHAHHINNWADNEWLRYDVNNGATMCDRCHYRFHSQYGKKNNTYDQLQQFISDNYLLDKKIC